MQAAVELQPGHSKWKDMNSGWRACLPATRTRIQNNWVGIALPQPHNALNRFSLLSVGGACHVGPAAAWCQLTAAVAAVYSVLGPFIKPGGHSWTVARPCSCILPSGTGFPALQVDSPIHFTQPGGVQVKADSTAQVRHAITLPIICAPVLSWYVFPSTAATCMILRCGKVGKNQVVRYFQHLHTGLHVSEGH